jgi:HJR/Mrr/RecB family endonuclease
MALALLCWLPLHVIAVETAEIPASDGGYAAVNADAPAKLAHTLAAALQYLIPGALLTGALVASLQRRRRIARGRERSRSVPVGAMLEEDFYSRLDAAFQARGYEALALEGAMPGASDLVVVRGASRCLVQRSHWRSWQVDESVIRALAAEVSAQHANGGYVVTGGWFSREARALAVECGIELVDGDALGDWFELLRDPVAKPPPRRAAAARPTSAVVPVLRPVVRAAPAGLAAPACPKCGGTMQRQRATRGKMEGQYYWACARQPKCLGILPCRAETARADYGAALTH